MAELTRLDITYTQLAERGEARVQAIAGAKVARGEAPVVAGRRQVPDGAAMLAELARIGSRETPVAVLARLGLLEEWPWPGDLAGPNGRRWRGTRPETRGAVVFDADRWGELAVQAILAEAIRAEPGAEDEARARSGARLALIVGRGA